MMRDYVKEKVLISGDIILIFGEPLRSWTSLS